MAGLCRCLPPATPDTAKGVGACYAAVALITEAIGSLPLRLYRHGDGDRKAAAEHPLHTVLHRAPNGQQSATEFWEWMVSSMLLTGNAYARVTRGFDGQCRALDPMVTDRVTIMRKGETIGGYEYTDRDGSAGACCRLRCSIFATVLDAIRWWVCHISAARAVIQRHNRRSGQSTFDNGTRASSTLSIPGRGNRAAPGHRRIVAKPICRWPECLAGCLLEKSAVFTPISSTLPITRSGLQRAVQRWKSGPHIQGAAVPDW